MKLDSVQFVHVVNHFGQHLQGASTVNVGDRPGQPAFDIAVVEEGPMPSVSLSRTDPNTKEVRRTLVPMTNVASYRPSPAPAAPSKSK
jgi:hypothetical protein